jgi:TatA/E family protein of Tat protein translocase
MPLIGTGHLWLVGILLIIVLIIWGPGKLPDVGSGLGRGIREFRKASAETKKEFSDATRAETPVESAASQSTPVASVPETLVQPTSGAAVEPSTVGGSPAAEPSNRARGA